MRGKVWLLNVWASWCASCRHEHPVLIDLAPLRRAADLRSQLQGRTRRRNRAGSDSSAIPTSSRCSTRKEQVGIDYGVYGVPETYLIDKQGMIRYKHIGILTPEIMKTKVLPLAKALGSDA